MTEKISFVILWSYGRVTIASIHSAWRLFKRQNVSDLVYRATKKTPNNGIIESAICIWWVSNICKKITRRLHLFIRVSVRGRGTEGNNNQTILGRISILTSFSSLNRVRFLSNKLNLGIWGSRKVHAMLHYGLKMVASLYYFVWSFFYVATFGLEMHWWR